METRPETRRFASLWPALALALALGACGDKPPPQAGSAAAPAPATGPATGQPAPHQAPAVPTPSAADAALARKVKSALAADPRINALEIDVVAAQGAVTLYGTAATRASREQATRVAANVEGVKAVDNKLAVVAGS